MQENQIIIYRSRAQKEIEDTLYENHGIVFVGTISLIVIVLVVYIIALLKAR